MNKQSANEQAYGNHNHTQREKTTADLLANPSDVVRTLHVFEYAIDLNRNRIPTKMLLDGEEVRK
jgi:hypothetical protein